MKKILFLGIISIFLISPIALSSGCAQVSGLRKAVQLTNEGIQHYQRSYDLFKAAVEKVNESMKMAEKAPAAGVQSAEEAENKLQEAQDEVEVAAAKFEEIKKLNVSDKYKKHADLRVKQLSAVSRAIQKSKEMATEVKKALQKRVSGKLTRTQLKASQDRISKIRLEINQYMNQANKYNQEAKQYFEEHIKK